MIVCRLLARIVSVLTLTAAVAGAQTPAPQPAPTPVKPKSAKPPATAGVEFGLALARVGPALEGESTERRPGAQFGIYGSVPWLKTVSLQGDLTFIQRHSRITSAGSSA